MTVTQVVNCRHESFDVFIGRPSKWGNPFEIGPGMTREQAIALFRVHVKRSGLLADLHELQGKRLGCFCAPDPCHGDVLVELANEST